MADHADLSVFEVPLLRLILCGGNGLPPAWGPMHHVHTHEDEVYPWDPVSLAASSLPSHLRDDEARIEMWSLPLDADSPWPARLALVAAWMAGESPTAAAIRLDNHEVWLRLFFAQERDTRHRLWLRSTGNNHVWPQHAERLRAPELPGLLAKHPPVVALPLALYAVPEIRARVEAAHV